MDQRQKELERLYNSRKLNKGHAPHISLSDPNAHVTDAFSSYYGEDEGGAMAPPVLQQDPRPLSFINTPSERETYASRSKRQGSVFDHSQHHMSHSEQHERSRRPSPPRHRSNEKLPSPTTSPVSNLSPQTSLHRMGSRGSDGISGKASPPPLSRQSSNDTAVQQFPLNDIDYESSPAAVAQELSNLQAIRRMSMSVDTADPDLPSFSGPFGGIPTVAPNDSDDDDDPSKLFWVPARLHPELAPKEFKTFIEDKVERIRRRSGGEDSLSPDTLERSGSESSLRRKKSMLSHQIDTRGHYEDGAERLERKRSKGMHVEGQTTVSNLSELETLVNDPSQLIRRMSLDTSRRSQDSGIEVSPTEDPPILPPVGTLKRSTRTTYRRGSLKKGERVPFSKRAQQRQTEPDVDDASAQLQDLPAAGEEHEPVLGLTRVQTEPTPAPRESPANFSRPGQRTRNGMGMSHSSENLHVDRETRKPHPEPPPPPPPPREEERIDESPRQHQQPPPPQPKQFQSRIASAGRTTAQLPGYNNTNPLPHIIETLPDGTRVPVSNGAQNIPERRSSHDVPRPYPRGGAHSRPIPGREHSRSSTLDDISSHPTPLPGSGGTRTDALTLVPTFDDKAEKKEGSKKSSWKWILGSDDDNKDKKGSDSASAKSKSSKLSKTQADKARLDVLQNSIDGTVPRGRESLVLNRDELRLDEGIKATGKKAADSSKKDKDKDSGLLSAIFGGKKKHSDGELKDKKRKSDRGLSPEPPTRILKPDIDYNWTRFSILEERAIYRMAHIKLANPRRALYSQVLLSNFMYSYLAKVQMMHPQVQIPPGQRAAQQQRSQKQDPQQSQDQQSAEYNQYQRWQEQQSRQEVVTAAPLNVPHNDTSSRSSFDTDNSTQRSSFDHEEQASNSYDQRSSEEYGRQAYSSQPGYPTTNGVGSSGVGHGGYSVASTHDYLGYAKDKQPFGDQQSLWENEEKSEELW